MCKKITVQKDYDRSARYYDRRYRLIQKMKFSFFKEDLRRSEFIVDLGSGTSLILKEGGLRAVRYLGVDISAEMIRVALNRRHFFKNFLIGDVENLPVRNNVVDCATVFTVMQNLENYSHLIKEIKRIITANGKVMLSVLRKIFNRDEFGVALKSNNLKLDKSIEDMNTEDVGLILSNT